MINSSPEALWTLAKKSDQYFLSNSDSIDNPIICFQAVLVGCAISILTIREKSGLAASNSLSKFFSAKISDYVNENSDLEDFATDDDEIFESQLNAFVEVLTPGNNIDHAQALASNLYLDPEIAPSPIDLLTSFKKFSIFTKGYKSMILENFSI